MKRINIDSLKTDNIEITEKKMIQLEEGIHIASNIFHIHGSDLAEFIAISQSGKQVYFMELDVDCGRIFRSI